MRPETHWLLLCGVVAAAMLAVQYYGLDGEAAAFGMTNSMHYSKGRLNMNEETRAAWEKIKRYLSDDDVSVMLTSEDIHAVDTWLAVVEMIPVDDIRRCAILAQANGGTEWTREAGANVLIWLAAPPAAPPAAWTPVPDGDYDGGSGAILEVDGDELGIRRWDEYCLAVLPDTLRLCRKEP